MIIFSHFNNRVSQKLADRVPVIRPISFPFDSIFSWAALEYRFEHNLPKSHPYFLSYDSTEWKRICRQFELNTKWLMGIKKGHFLRYEDWFLNKHLNLKKLKQVLPEVRESDFQVSDNRGRLYFTHAFQEKMDKTVFEHIKRTFSRALELYWPETIGGITY